MGCIRLVLCGTTLTGFLRHQKCCGQDMGPCVQCGRLNRPHSLQNGHLSHAVPPGLVPGTTSSPRWQSQHRRWRATETRQQQLCKAATEVSTDAPAAAVAVPVITPTESALDCNDKPYTCHSWRWREHAINYAVRLEAFRLVGSPRRPGFNKSRHRHYRPPCPSTCDNICHASDVKLAAFQAYEKIYCFAYIPMPHVTL